MTLLFKMQEDLVTFSLTLMLKARVLFIFLWRLINSNLNSNFYDKILKEMKDPMCWFLKILFQCTRNNNASIKYV